MEFIAYELALELINMSYIAQLLVTLEPSDVHAMVHFQFTTVYHHSDMC